MRPGFCIVSVTSALLLFGGPASAGGSAAAFSPFDSANAAIVGQNGYYLWNESADFSALVTADFGVGPAANKSATVYGWTEGGNFNSCFITATALHSPTRVTGNFAYAPSARGPFQLPLTLSAPPAGDDYAYQIECIVGNMNPLAPGGEQIWGFQ
ncbi:MAG: hypothetical protein FWD17_11305 [Polyangiaceae bacterium]|nr:hypothetical protein [Polyangiaceae bacterium]